MAIRAILIGMMTCALGSGEAPRCTCAQAKLQHAWCDACAVGYVASFPVKSRELYEAIHPHGHAVNAAVIQCTGCQQAVFADGWCTSCKAGYVAGQAYFSKLTYLLAFGDVVDPQTLKCASCRKCASRAGWCDACGRGWVGDVRFMDRDKFEPAAQALDIFFLADKKSAQCELCAEAMVMNSRCPKCRVTYLDGKPLEASRP